MKFRYKGRGPGGKPVTGSISAPSRAEALSQLQQSGVLVSALSAESVSLSLSMNVDLKSLLVSNRKITSGELAAMCSQFSTLVAAGVPLLQILDLLAQQFRPGRLSTILVAVRESVQSGNSLSQSMRAHRGLLPEALIYITAVAEMSGQLELGYQLLARQFEQEDNVARKVKSAMTYPTVVLTVATAVVIFMLTYVLPNYTAMFSSLGAELPTPTKILMAVSDFVRHRWWLLVPVPFLVVWGWRSALKNRSVRSRYQELLLHLPVIKPLVYKREFGRLCRTLGTMIGSGVPLLSALGMAREAMEFIPMSRALDGLQESVRVGESFGNALKRQRLFDHISVEMISLGEASGNLETMLLRVADLAEKDLSAQLDRSTALLEPAMTLVLGLIVVSIIVPILLPMFDIFRQIH